MQAKIFLTIMVILSFVASSLSIAAGSASISDVEAKAKTKFDHIGLAEYYEKEAKALNEKVEEQRKLLEEYKNHSEYYGREGQDFQSHHEALLRKYTKAVERNMEMAASHRKIAEKMK
ncbi:hypothetical protein [Nitrosomonas sp. Nm166]|uniref:hypothetical protein n=1 Tax=Nitrosomonas sp. Nm166 TaxID=1881054 RepID=UPI0008F1B5AD|nr:hypothetical protein [Nitrosomonas sp. Nm166]SFF07862.1 hypothetical protein SAMN05428977_104727 [Nitrosomonas sp. Nm166]